METVLKRDISPFRTLRSAIIQNSFPEPTYHLHNISEYKVGGLGNKCLSKTLIDLSVDDVQRKRHYLFPEDGSHLLLASTEIDHP